MCIVQPIPLAALYEVRAIEPWYRDDEDEMLIQLERILNRFYIDIDPWDLWDAYYVWAEADQLKCGAPCGVWHFN